MLFRLRNRAKSSRTLDKPNVAAHANTVKQSGAVLKASTLMRENILREAASSSVGARCDIENSPEHANHVLLHPPSGAPMSSKNNRNVNAFAAKRERLGRQKQPTMEFSFLDDSESESDSDGQRDDSARMDAKGHHELNSSMRSRISHSDVVSERSFVDSSSSSSSNSNSDSESDNDVVTHNIPYHNTPSASTSTITSDTTTNNNNNNNNTHQQPLRRLVRAASESRATSAVSYHRPFVRTAECGSQTATADDITLTQLVDQFHLQLRMSLSTRMQAVREQHTLPRSRGECRNESHWLDVQRRQQELIESADRAARIERDMTTVLKYLELHKRIHNAMESGEEGVDLQRAQKQLHRRSTDDEQRPVLCYSIADMSRVDLDVLVPSAAPHAGRAPVPGRHDGSRGSDAQVQTLEDLVRVCDHGDAGQTHQDFVLPHTQLFLRGDVRVAIPLDSSLTYTHGSVLRDTGVHADARRAALASPNNFVSVGLPLDSTTFSAHAGGFANSSRASEAVSVSASVRLPDARPPHTSRLATVSERPHKHDHAKRQQHKFHQLLQPPLAHAAKRAAGSVQRDGTSPSSTSVADEYLRTRAKPSLAHMQRVVQRLFPSGMLQSTVSPWMSTGDLVMEDGDEDDEDADGGVNDLVMKKRKDVVLHQRIRLLSAEADRKSQMLKARDARVERLQQQLTQLRISQARDGMWVTKFNYSGRRQGRQVQRFLFLSDDAKVISWAKDKSGRHPSTLFVIQIEEVTFTPSLQDDTAEDGMQHSQQQRAEEEPHPPRRSRAATMSQLLTSSRHHDGSRSSSSRRQPPASAQAAARHTMSSATRAHEPLMLMSIKVPHRTLDVAFSNAEEFHVWRHVMRAIAPKRDRRQRVLSPTLVRSSLSLLRAMKTRHTVQRSLVGDKQ